MTGQTVLNVCSKCNSLTLNQMDYLDICESCYFKLVEEYTKQKEKQEYEKKLNKMRTVRR